MSQPIKVEYAGLDAGVQAFAQARAAFDAQMDEVVRRYLSMNHTGQVKEFGDIQIRKLTEHRRQLNQTLGALQGAVAQHSIDTRSTDHQQGNLIGGLRT